MSVPENAVWLEAAKDNFDEAVAIGNYALAQDVIADTADQGFEKEAEQMKQELLDTPVTRFLSVISPYTHGVR